jgi:hypothetical protein
MSETAVRNYLSGGEPIRRALRFLSAASRVDPCWLAFGIGAADEVLNRTIE